MGNNTGVKSMAKRVDAGSIDGRNEGAEGSYVLDNAFASSLTSTCSPVLSAGEALAGGSAGGEVLPKNVIESCAPAPFTKVPDASHCDLSCAYHENPFAAQREHHLIVRMSEHPHIPDFAAFSDGHRHETTKHMLISSGFCKTQLCRVENRPCVTPVLCSHSVHMSARIVMNRDSPADQQSVDAYIDARQVSDAERCSLSRRVPSMSERWRCDVGRPSRNGRLWHRYPIP
nr:hypothetical protein CFP56_10265 [Quercus suber]